MLFGQGLRLLLGETALGQTFDEAMGVEGDGLIGVLLMGMLTILALVLPCGPRVLGRDYAAASTCAACHVRSYMTPRASGWAASSTWVSASAGRCGRL